LNQARKRSVASLKSSSTTSCEGFMLWRQRSKTIESYARQVVRLVGAKSAVHQRG
jgi:hypothetical protein